MDGFRCVRGMQRADSMVVKVSLLLSFIIFISSGIHTNNNAFGEALQILSKSKLEKCERSSADAHGDLNCTRKILVNIAIPSNSSGGEASIVAEVVEVEENSTNKMQTLRVPPVITINKSAAYALFELTYIRFSTQFSSWVIRKQPLCVANTRDVPYKPQEFYVQTRKCEPDADARIVQICERLRDEQGHIIEASEPICCPCGDRRRVPSSCGNFFDKIVKGKANTAHCLRFPGDWFHVFGIGQRTLGFSIRIAVKTASKVSEVIVGPENRTAISNDNFLRVNMVGDFAGYTNIPSFEDFYLVIPTQHGPGQPPDLGRNFSMWMLLERVRFTLDGLECNKIGVGYEAFNGQPDFCAAPFWSCLHNQLWNFFEADQNRIGRNQPPLYGVIGRFERINDHPCVQDAGPRSFSIGITEVLNTNLLIELGADDIEYVYQRSPGKILGITVPTFEALAQFGIAKIETKNVGEVEASYSLTFQCSKGVMMMEEQFFIMKPEEVVTRSFKIDPTTDQAAKYACSAILKDSEFKEVDRAECQFTTTATVLDNGTQGPPFQPPKSAESFFESIKSLWNKFWAGLSDFITGKSCRSKCSGLLDFQCHMQYVCISWVVMLGLFLSIFPTVLVLLWLLHQKGFFDPIYDCWEDQCWDSEQIRKNGRNHRVHNTHGHGHHRNQANRRHYRHELNHKHRRNQGEYRHHQSTAHRQLNDRQKHGRHRNVGLIQDQESHWDKDQEHDLRLHRHRKDRTVIKRTTRFRIDDEDDIHEPFKDGKHHLLDEKYGIRRRDIR